MYNLEGLIETNSVELSLKLLARAIDSLIEPKQLVFEKISEEAITPVKAHQDDMCFDVFASSDPIVNETYIQYHTGIRLQIPDGYAVEMPPRSSVSGRDLILANGVGQIDTGYRGELLVRFKYVPRATLFQDQVTGDITVRGEHDHTVMLNPKTAFYKKGDAIAQIKLVKKITTVLVEAKVNLDTTRSDKGFGSSGNVSS